MTAGVSVPSSGSYCPFEGYTNNAHYWQVYFDTNRVISEEFGAAGYPVPSTQTVLRQA